MDTTSFVDTRLHISVRPSLEYIIPETALAVVSVLLGDTTIDETLQSIDKCLVDTPQTTPVAEDDDHPIVCKLRQLCSRVCTHTSEHLKMLSLKWCDHVRTCQTQIQHDLQDLKLRTEDVRSTHRRLRNRNKTVVDKEYFSELRNIERELNQRIDVLRNRSHPDVRRPEELVSATTQLKETFASSYGKIPTQKLMRIKGHFENELCRVQSEVALAFAKSMTKYLKLKQRSTS